MVFGWGKKKQEDNQIEESPKEKEISLSEVQNILIDFNQLRKSQTLSEIKHLRKKTTPLIDDLKKIGNVLANDDLNIDEIDKHLAVIIVRGKKQVLDIIKKGVTPLPEISSIDEAKKLDSSLNQILKKLGDVLGRQTRVIHIFAKKYASQLKENLEEMNSNHSEIQKLLRNYDSTVATSDEITEALNQIDTLKHTREEKTQKIEEVNQSIESLEKQISSIQDSINEIKSSDSYQKYLNLKNKLGDFDSQKLKIKNEIDEQFTKISRPLSRYEYVSSLDKEQKSLLTKLVENPFEVLLPQNKDPIIIILENVRKGILSDSISVKDVEKSLSQLTETEESLDRFTQQVSEYFDKYKQMQNTLNSLIPTKLISLEHDLSKNISFKEDAILKSETFHGEIDEIDSKMPELVSEIEAKLRQFSNTKYTIILS